MKPFHALSAIEQLAAHLRGEIQAGTLGETLPGVHRLAKDLGVSPKTVVAAVAQLEHEGLLHPQGARRPCLITPHKAGAVMDLKVRIVLYERSERGSSGMIDLRHRLAEAGHRPEFASKDIHELGMDFGRVERFMKANPADAWVICGGSEEILEGFVDHPLPVFALFGPHAPLRIAGASAQKVPAMLTAVRRLVALGHRRIVMLAREERRKPQPALYEKAFLDELSRHGIQTGRYNLPDWEDTREGFHRGLDSLFQHTPPTALIINESMLFTAAQQYLAHRGIVAPNHISMICDDPDPSFAWCEPAISHIRWDPAPLLRGIVRWANQVARGKRPCDKTFSVAKFVEGGTIGAVSERSGMNPRKDPGAQ
ncbi:MAG TPA: substrate-binding domain-containing protein [Luteolibacter sp.]|nr:substrate-binding domain-containing protein [Luteolibacter sp.]